MACNCEPKKYNISLGCCTPVLAPIENYYTKWQVDDLIESATTSGCCITPEEVDEKIESAKTEIEAEIPSLSGYATEQWVLDKHYISGVDLSNYALKSEIPTVPTKVSAFENDVPYLTEHQSLSGYATEAFVSAYTYDKATIDEKVAGGGTFDPTNYYNKTEVNNIVNSAKTEVENEIPSLNGYATEQWVLDKHYISGVDLSDYALKSEIPVVPTSNTAFTNDAGYLTEHQSLTAYSTTNEVNTLINQSVSGKADTTAVNNINSALTAHTADTTIHVTQTEKNTWNSKVDSSTLNNYMLKTQIWCGTQAQYDAITTKDNSVIYLIHE